MFKARAADSARPGRNPTSGRFWPSPLAPWWAGPLFLFLAVALVPWIIYLASTLPSHTEVGHYRLAWVGFDIVLVISLGRTAWLALKGKRQMEFSAVVSATLLVVDAWFDITISKSGTAQMEAIFLAVFVELPTAFLALYLSRRVNQAVDRTLEQARRLPPHSEQASASTVASAGNSITGEEQAH